VVVEEVPLLLVVVEEVPLLLVVVEEVPLLLVVVEEVPLLLVVKRPFLRLCNLPSFMQQQHCRQPFF
jgi:hypothetical protein